MGDERSTEDLISTATIEAARAGRRALIILCAMLASGALVSLAAGAVLLSTGEEESAPLRPLGAVLVAVGVFWILLVIVARPHRSPAVAELEARVNDDGLSSTLVKFLDRSKLEREAEKYRQKDDG